MLRTWCVACECFEFEQLFLYFALCVNFVSSSTWSLCFVQVRRYLAEPQAGKKPSSGPQMNIVLAADKAARCRRLCDHDGAMRVVDLREELARVQRRAVVLRLRRTRSRTASASGVETKSSAATRISNLTTTEPPRTPITQI